MKYENRSQADELKERIDIDKRRSSLEDRPNDPEIAFTALLAREFGHVALRYASQEIPKQNFDQFHELYIDKIMKHTTVIDRVAVAKDFDVWVDAMLPAAQADIYDAMVEQGVNSLPEFIPPKVMSEEMANSSDKKLLQENVSLKEENARLMNQAVGMSKQMRELRKQLGALTEERDNLVIAAGSVRHDVLANG